MEELDQLQSPHSLSSRPTWSISSRKSRCWFPPLMNMSREQEASRDQVLDPEELPDHMGPERRNSSVQHLTTCLKRWSQSC
ncbi:hypothetical protein EYF80_033981 [Liparis tanakae]|uniref:Uncharacterized protein n=1 Tax=Liparis tanakae TaxID=230148 RepID=A0A4Z2GR00_9TELE|nr:hypothetical protein EYF80_033981 [Liparis tanakae]